MRCVALRYVALRCWSPLAIRPSWSRPHFLAGWHYAVLFTIRPEEPLPSAWLHLHNKLYEAMGDIFIWPREHWTVGRIHSAGLLFYIYFYFAASFELFIYVNDSARLCA